MINLNSDKELNLNNNILSLQQEKFIIDSVKERILLEKLETIIPRFQIIEFSDILSYDKYDAIINWRSKQLLVEAKKRDYASTAFGSWIIEKPKFDYLIASTENNDYTPIYLNAYNDGYIRIWFLDDLTLNWEHQIHQKNNHTNKNTNVNKAIAFLSNSDSIYIQTGISYKDIEAEAINYWDKYKITNNIVVL